MSPATKISISVIIVLIITFSVLIILQSVFSNTFEKTVLPVSIIKDKDNFLQSQEFYTKDFSNGTTIFIMGSSQVGSLIATEINDKISLDIPIEVYNIAKGGDTPKQRLGEIDQIIFANPKIVFYGISYRDFSFPYDSLIPLLPDPKQIIPCSVILDNEEILPSNPQWLTRNILKSVFKISDEGQSDEKLKQDTKYFAMKNTPFYPYLIKQTTAGEEEIRNEVLPTKTWNNQHITNQNICALQSLVSQLEDNKIKIIIFTTPLTSYYLESLSNSQKYYFTTLQHNLIDDYGLTLYDLEENYTELDIWLDSSHVVSNTNSTIFVQDLAKIITKEIKK